MYNATATIKGVKVFGMYGNSGCPEFTIGKKIFSESQSEIAEFANSIGLDYEIYCCEFTFKGKEFKHFPFDMFDLDKFRNERIEDKKQKEEDFISKLQIEIISKII